MVMCFYCKEDAKDIMVCNDWGNIPLCGSAECNKKFEEENTSQFFVVKVKSLTKESLEKEFGKGYERYRQGGKIR